MDEIHVTFYDFFLDTVSQEGNENANEETQSLDLTSNELECVDTSAEITAAHHIGHFTEALYLGNTAYPNAETIDYGGVLSPNLVEMHKESPLRGSDINSGEPWTMACQPTSTDWPVVNQPGLSNEGLTEEFENSLSMLLFRQDASIEVKALVQRNAKFWDDGCKRSDIPLWGKLRSLLDHYNSRRLRHSPVSGGQA